MKINNINNPGFYPDYKASRKDRAGGRSGEGGEDQVSFTKEGLSFSKTLAEVRDRSEARSASELARIDEIRQQVNQGTYHVDSDKIAEKMLLGFFGE